ncbi:hypothetical protein A2U01_0085458, partial [Trifolium medium]|nr:hypothetical protein [Trifolium medium]
MQVFCQLRAAQGVLARCARTESEEWIVSAICASRRQEWRVAPVSKDRAPELSVNCAPRRSGW